MDAKRLGSTEAHLSLPKRFRLFGFRFVNNFQAVPASPSIDAGMQVMIRLGAWGLGFRGSFVNTWKGSSAVHRSGP